MIKQTLVCLEGSPSCTSATQTAIAIAREHQGSLVGLAIVDEPDIRAGAATGFGGTTFKRERDEALLADAHKQATDWLALFERRCREAGVQARALEVVGRPAASILEEAAKHDLTVIGRDANFRFETDPNDAETRDAVLQRAAGPVLIVPESATGPIGRHVVIAYDGGQAAARAAESFASSGLARGRAIHVATIDNNGARAWEVASRGVALLAERGVAAEAHNIVTAVSNIEALFRFCNEVDAGLVVMGAFAHSRLAQLFHGSVTRGLVDKTEIPLYLQH
jgi:nucleotide-binding universal stress UspA family protein